MRDDPAHGPLKLAGLSFLSSSSSLSYTRGESYLPVSVTVCCLYCLSNNLADFKSQISDIESCLACRYQPLLVSFQERSIPLLCSYLTPTITISPCFSCLWKLIFVQPTRISPFNLRKFATVIHLRVFFLIAYCFRHGVFFFFAKENGGFEKWHDKKPRPLYPPPPTQALHTETVLQEANPPPLSISISTQIT